jgi:hypothetical protein
MPEKNEEFSREEVTTEEHSFDELAKGVADGTLPRGKALKSVFAALVGGLLGGFALAPREAEARVPRTIWVVVNSDGTIARSNGGFSRAEKLDTGYYRVVAKRTIGSCAMFATIEEFSLVSGGGTGQISIYPSSQVGYVNTARSDGVAVDKTFHFIAHC